MDQFEIFKKVEFEDGMPITPLGWRPPTEEDFEQLETTRGASAVDLDQLMAMPPRDTFLYRYLDMVLKIYHNDPGYKWKNQYQKFGTCVGQAAKVGADDLMAINSLIYGMEFPGRAAVAGSYTFARVEIANQPGRWEGANGVNAAAAFLRLGVLLLKHVNLPDDATDADENLAMQWTAQRTGVPKAYEDMAQNILVEDVINPTSVKMVGKLLQAGAPVFVGTTYIPTGRCNSQGISPCQRSRGGHEMSYRAVVWENGEPKYILQQQSWYPGWASGGKLVADQPVESVWITAADAAKQIADGDCSAIIGTNGLKYKG